MKKRPTLCQDSDNMKTTRIKVSEATNVQLDWLVATCQGIDVLIHKNPTWAIPLYVGNEFQMFAPSSDPSQMSPFIKREKISVIAYDGMWRATNGRNVVEEAYSFTQVPRDPSGNMLDGFVEGEADQYGATPELAAARCLVASRLGETAEIPIELVETTSPDSQDQSMGDEETSTPAPGK